MRKTIHFAIIAVFAVAGVRAVAQESSAVQERLDNVKEKVRNEQPIKIVSEQWFSPDLKVLVLTKHSDPRVGETTYRLANIVRADQPRSLFEVPPDYTVKESFIRRENR
jgi:hypothetical protein